MPRVFVSAILCFVFLLSPPLLGQNYDADGVIRKSESLIEKKQSGEAKTLLRSVLAVNADNVLALIAMGKAFLAENDYKSACQNFDNAYAIDPTLVHNENLQQYAMALKQNGDYPRAQARFRDLLTDPMISAKRKKRIQNEIIGIVEVLNESLPAYQNQLSPIGSNSEGSEFGPYPSSIGLSFTRSIKSEGGLSVENFLTDSNYTEITALEINQALGLMSNVQIYGDEVFFSLSYEGKTSIYNGNLSKSNKIKSIFPLEIINSEGDNTQAFVFRKNGSDVILFASNRGSEEKQYDLYYSVRNQGVWIEPKALPTSVNSPGNEISPYFDGAYLYFASDFYPGLGGYDIFRSKSKNFIGFESPENLGTPFNSVANDLYFKLDEKQGQGFLSSNRLGSVVGESETCCNDIYTFPWPPKIELKSSQKNPEKSGDAPKEKRVNRIISELQALLPLRLYFHNDIPKPNAPVPIYTQTYFPYKLMEKGYLNQNYSSATQTFFQETLSLEYSRLQSFTALMQALFIEDIEIEFTVKGFASPLATNTYNKALSQRRIQSFINELFAYRSGLFNGYRENISYREVANGEEKSADNVSDDRKNPRQSIYAIDAMLERKIEVVNIGLKNDLKQKIAMTSDTTKRVVVNKIQVLDSIDLGKKNISAGLVTDAYRTDSIAIKNPYDGDFNIDSIVASCGCTEVSVDKKIIPAYGSIMLYAKRELYDGNPKPVTIRFESTEPERSPNFIISLD